jgi:hypothetical protein
VKRLIVAVVLILLGCRGESVPRDYQNAPPAMTHPPQNAKQTPAANGMQAEAPNPSTGVEGRKNSQQPVTPPATGTSTMPDTPPVTTMTTTTTVTTAATTTT